MTEANLTTNFLSFFQNGSLKILYDEQPSISFNTKKNTITINIIDLPIKVSSNQGFIKKLTKAKELAKNLKEKEKTLQVQLSGNTVLKLGGKHKSKINKNCYIKQQYRNHRFKKIKGSKSDVLKIASIVIITLLVVSMSNQVFAHKLIQHDDSHRNFDLALNIPDHKISWAIYENLGTNEVKYYTFDAKKGDPFYASILIPKIQGLEEYAPAMIITNSEMNFREKIIFEGNFPSKEFYEPFGQVTYYTDEQKFLRSNMLDGNTF